MATIKFKILEVQPENQSVIVNYYTDELVAAVTPARIQRANALREENPSWTQEQAMGIAEREYYAGSIVNVTLYGDSIPTGQDLIDYISDKAPTDWLELKSKLAASSVDMTPLQSLVGVEHQAVAKQVLSERARQRAAEAAANTFIPVSEV